MEPHPDSDSQEIISLRKAIQALEAQRETLGDAVVDASITTLKDQIKELESKVELRQQRKLVTLLFMDIVGSTSSVSTRLDPEDTLEIMDQTLKRLAQPIEEHSGHVTRYMGDGFMAIFGSPVARENDPEMAIRAGLNILKDAQVIAEELQAIWDISEFQVRIGINTGLVALGGMTEAEDTIMGATVNLAARLESAASPGGLLISHDTYKHVRGLFNVEPQELITVKGFDDPIQVYLVQEAKPRAFHLSTRGVEGVETRMVGREAELKFLQDALKNASQNSEGQMITICGEAGVGKSRLQYEFQSWIELLPEEIMLFQGRAHQETQNQPYALLRNLFTQRFQIQDDDPGDIARSKVEAGFTAVLGTDQNGIQRAHIIGQLLGFDFSTSPKVQEVLEDAQGLRDRSLVHFNEYLESASHRSPVIAFLEDIHWADDSSLDILSLLANRFVDLPMLIVCLARPSLYERRLYWGEGQSHHHRLNLAPLTKWESRQLVEEILKKVSQVPAALRELIVGGAEGNPYYIEELIKMLVEGGVIVKGEETWWVEPTRLTEIEVPPTLTGVLQARLDTLPPEERHLLQAASVIGRTFWDRTLEYLVTSEDGDSAETDIRTVLTSMRQKELIFRRQDSIFVDSGEYIFKHAILRDVTYESVLKRKRRSYHEQIAQWLIDHSAERAGEYSGLIADHLERAGQGEKALPYLIQAGERAARQYANTEAVNYFTRALVLTPEDDLAVRCELLLARERVLEIQGLRELQAQDLAALKQMAQELDDVCLQAKVALRQVIFYNRTGNFPASLDMMEEAIQLAQQADDINCEAALQMQWGIALWRQGKYTSARPTLEQALSMAQSADLEQVEGDGIRTLGPAFVRTLADKQSLSRFEGALEKYRQAGDRRGEAYTLNNLGAYYSELKGNLTKAREYYEQALPVWRDIGDRRGEGLTVFNLGINAAESGDIKEGINQLSESLEIRRQVGDRWGERLTQTYLGKYRFQQGLYGDVIDHYHQAILISKEIGDRRGELTTLGLVGNYFRDLGDFDQARSHYDQILEDWEGLDQIQDRAEFQFNLSLFQHQVGEDHAALERCQGAQDLISGGDDLELEWMGLTVQGHCHLALGKFKEAEIAYKKASSKARKWRKPIQDYESSAGFARVMLAQDKAEGALRNLEKLLSYIQNSLSSGTSSPLDGAMEPLRIYLTCYKILQANRDGRAQRVLENAYQLVQSRAAVIDDEDLRSAYLNDIASNHEVIAEYTSQQDRLIDSGGSKSQIA